MGAGIAHALLLAGAHVILLERDNDAATTARARVEKAVRDTLVDGVCDGVGVLLGVFDGVLDGVGELLGVIEGVGELDGVGDGLGDGHPSYGHGYVRHVPCIVTRGAVVTGFVSHQACGFGFSDSLR